MHKSVMKTASIVPAPVLIIGTYNPDGTPNAMNAAWGTMVETDTVAICLSADHQTTENILRRKSFTLSFADKKNLVAADYVGDVSYKRDPKKVEKTGWHIKKAKVVDAPYFEELPVVMECSFIRYDEETGFLYGKVQNVLAEDSLLNAKGRPDLEKLELLTYDSMSHGYYVIREKAGNAFKDGLALKDKE